MARENTHALALLQIQNMPTSAESEDDSADDEPPDSRFGRASIVPREHKESLLTKALLTNEPVRPMARGMSMASTSSTELTTDGNTSPSRSNTPSPPPPNVLNLLPTNEKPALPESNVEALLGRRRCLTFACSRKPSEEVVSTESRPEEARRPSMLRFACPSREGSQALIRKPSPHPQVLRDATPKPSPKASKSESPVTSKQTLKTPGPVAIKLAVVKKSASPVADRSETTRFHEFGSSVDEGDDWTHEATVHTRKITIGDLCSKDEKYRKLAEEVEEEVKEEGNEEEIDDEEEDDFTDGNETDNEAGFADSDDSDADSAYEFWAPARRTEDYVEHIRPSSERRMSQSSIDSAQSTHHAAFLNASPRKFRKRPLVADVSDLPDSTDFVCGTLDEDRPLEEAYKSQLEERRRSKHLRPQDIDPSFPSDDERLPSDDDDEEDELWIKNQLKSDGESKPTSPAKLVFLSPTPKRTHMLAKRSRSPSPRRKSIAVHTPAPGLMRTKSLQQRKAPKPDSLPTIRRGAIDIVKGLERKNKKRCEKLQAKRKEKPGQGVEKMRELGLEMQLLRPKDGKAGPWILSV